tara:strand:+ start:418 stop:1164 length:747 start_codon:yes stop_codon:yes gene_type:complete
MLEAMHTSIPKISLVRRLTALLLCAVPAWIGIESAPAEEWMTWNSTYTHAPNSGMRVDQYNLPVQPEAPFRADYQSSGYRNYRSTLQVGQTSDNYHRTEQWGRQIQPYEQWRFPYHPYAVPYSQWGPQAPYGIFNGAGYGGYYPTPYPGTGFPGTGFPGGGHAGNPPSSPPHHGPPPAGNQPPAGYSPPGYGGYPGSNYPGSGYPNYPGSRGFPLSPTYNGQPWYDGNYPDAPPLDTQSDREFFYRPR